MKLKIAWLIAKAFVFAQTAVERGYKYKRAVTCLGSVLENISNTLTDNERRMLIKKINKLGQKFYMSYYEYLDCLNEAMELMKNTRFKYLVGCVALSSNVEVLEDEEDTKEKHRSKRRMAI